MLDGQYQNALSAHKLSTSEHEFLTIKRYLSLKTLVQFNYKTDCYNHKGITDRAHFLQQICSAVQEKLPYVYMPLVSGKQLSMIVLWSNNKSK